MQKKIFILILFLTLLPNVATMRSQVLNDSVAQPEKNDTLILEAVDDSVSQPEIQDSLELESKDDSKAQTAYKNTFEFGANCDYVSDGFGHWSLGRIKYTHAGQKLTWFINTDFMYRRNWGGFTFSPSIGAYSDWCKRFYTYECITASTKSEYSPTIRGDLDLNFKAGSKMNWVITLGASAMYYYWTDQSIYIPAVGLTYYHPGIVVSGRFMYNICNPGTNSSFTGLLALDQGYWYKYMNTLLLSFGNQSYLISSMGSPALHVERNALYISFRHRYWIRRNWGIQAQIEYSNTFNAYWMLGGSIGFFFHF